MIASAVLACIRGVRRTPRLRVHGAVLSLDVLRVVDVQDVCIEELAGLYGRAVGWWVGKCVLTLLRASRGAELGVEHAIEDGAPEIGVVAVLVVRRVDRRATERDRSTIARDGGNGLIRIA